MNEFNLQIQDKTFQISLFCAKKVGDTENMKFRLKCLQDPSMDQDFDDFEGLKNHVFQLLQDKLDDYTTAVLSAF